MSQEVFGDQGYLLYVYIDHHVRRNIGEMEIKSHMFTSWSESLPNYVYDDNNELVKAGYMSDRHILNSFYNFLSSLAISEVLNINLPIPSESHALLTVDLIEQSRDEYLETFPDGKFIVLVHPLGWGDHSLFIIRELNRRPITTLEYELADFGDYSDLILPAVISNDHPNSKLNRLLGTKLTSQILQY